jgi:SulP family sulfate permease
MTLRDLMTAAIMAAITLCFSLSLAALIFSGPLAAGLPSGIAVAILGSGLVGMAVAVFSSFRGAIAAPDTPTVAALALVAASAAVETGGPVSVPTVFALIAVSALGTGGVLYLLGALKAGRWMRYVPYPVVGGFLAASGVLLLLGALRVSTGLSIDLAHAVELAGAPALGRFGAACAIGVALFVVIDASKKPALLPVLLVGAALMVHGVLAALGLPIEEARAAGWVLTPPAAGVGGASWFWISDETASVAWSKVAEHAGDLATTAGVTAVTILLNAAGIEVAERSNADLDRELKANGIANLLAGAAGGLVGNLTLNRCLLAMQIGGQRRAHAVLAGLLVLLPLAFGMDFVGYVPTPVLGGMLVMLGLGMLREWLIRARKRLSTFDYLLILALVALILRFGYLEGALLGIIASCLFFAATYSRLGAVKRHLTRAEYSSYVDRPATEARYLRDVGERIHIVWLQGYVFFGTSNGLFEYLKARIERTESAGIDFVVLDFREVPGIDSSASYSFVKLRHLAEEKGIGLQFCATRPEIEATLRAEGFFAEIDRVSRLEPTLDRALEHCEDRLVERAGSALDLGIDLESWLAREIGEAEHVRRLIHCLEPLAFEPGAHVFRQGDAPDSLFLLVDGRVSVLLERPPAEPVRLRSMIGPAIVGEMGLYRGAMRTASVVADTPVRLHRLSIEKFAELQRQSPAAAGAFHAFIVRVLSDRLGFANREIEALQR